MGIFDIEVMSFVRPKVTANFALIAGSSRHGKALLASVGWNWVTAIYLKGLINIISIYLPGSLHILVTWFFVFWLSRTTKIIFYVCLLTHFARQDRQNGNFKNKQNHTTTVTKIWKNKVTKMKWAKQLFLPFEYLFKLCKVFLWRALFEYQNIYMFAINWVWFQDFHASFGGIQ